MIIVGGRTNVKKIFHWKF